MKIFELMVFNDSECDFICLDFALLFEKVWF